LRLALQEAVRRKEETQMKDRPSDHGYEEPGDNRVAIGMLLGMLLGVVTGPVIGAATRNWAAGLAIGAGIGGSVSAGIGTLLSEPQRGPSWREMGPGLGILIAGILTLIALAGMYISA
jgi:hypothetical protein